MSDLSSKTAIITGASQGIGRACATTLGQEGARVVVSDLPDTGGEEFVEELTSSDIQAIFVACDVTDPEQVQHLVSTAVDEFGGLHIAVNNAGIGGERNPCGDYSFEEWQRVLNVNLNGVFLCLKEEIQTMLKSGGGSIINMASILGQVGTPDAPAYVAAKHAVVGLTKASALEYASKNIRINAVGPAYIDTPLIQPLKEDKKTLKAIVGMHPIGRIGEPEEIADLVAFLASDKASFMTGGYYPADGGYLSQ